MTPTRLSLACNFAAANFLDPIFTFTRASTATRINKTTGLIETVAANVPRLEKDGLLIEGAATNYIQTQQRDDWVFWDTIQSGSLTAPDGTSTTALTFGSSNQFRSADINLPAGQYTCSLWARGAAAEILILTAAWSFVAGVTVPSGDAWHRVTFTFTTTGDSLFLYFKGSPGNTIAIACAQIEAGPIATSYIPTNGTPVTRSAENCFANLAESWWQSDTWTITLSATGITRGCLVDFDDMLGAAHIGVWVEGDTLRADNRQETFRWPLPADGRVRLAMAQDAAGWRATLNGGEVKQSPNPQNLSSAKRLYLGHNRGYNDQIGGHIRELSICPKVFSAGVLQAMSRL